MEVLKTSAGKVVAFVAIVIVHKIGNATVGRQEVGILGILHGLTIRELFLRVRTSFGWRRGKLPDNRRGVWRELPLARHICARKAHQSKQCTSTVARDANTRGSSPTRLKAQHGSGWCIVVTPKRFRHPSVLPHMLPPLSLNTSARSFSPTLPVFRPSSPSLSCPLELDQETLRDSLRSGGSAESASPAGSSTFRKLERNSVSPVDKKPEFENDLRVEGVPQDAILKDEEQMKETTKKLVEVENWILQKFHS